MSDDRGLTDVALPDLEALLQLLERERIRFPLTETGLASHGLGHLAEGLVPLGALDPATLQAVLRVVLAERRYRPVPRVDLVWTGPEAYVSTSRDTLVVVRELFENEKSVLIGGYAFDHGKDIFAPLHRVMRERGVATTIFVNTVEGFLESNWPFGAPHPEIYSDPRTADSEAASASTPSASSSTRPSPSSPPPTSPTGARPATSRWASSSKTPASRDASSSSGGA